MKRISRLSLTVGAIATLALGACGDGADTDAADTTATGAGDSSMQYTPADSGLPTNADSNSTAAPDTTGAATVGAGADTAGASAAGAAGASNASSTGASGSEIGALVEAQLMTWPGLADVKVTTSNDGTVELTGTVATAQDKQDAENEVRKIPGVKSVKNNITVK